MSDRFPVKVDGQWREVEISFASKQDVKKLAYWRIPKPVPQAPFHAQKIYDAIEFARMAGNRWRDYQRQHLTVTSIEGLRRFVREYPTAEVAMALVARPAWRSSISTLGIAYLRRTWCNHLYLEFLANHPQVIARRREHVSGVGLALLHQIVALAEQLEVPCIWGEATEGSHDWYKDRLSVDEVRDHFFIEDEVRAHCLSEVRRAQAEMLARRATL